MSNWIKVADRLPTIADNWRKGSQAWPTVRVWDAAWDTQYEALYYEDDNNLPTWEPTTEREPEQRITHWQPLPQAPDEDNQ